MDIFHGEFNVNLDNKGRIALPSKIRPRHEDGSSLELTLAPGMEGCLALYTPEAWDGYMASLSSLNYGAEDLRAYKRYLFPKTAKVVPDQQGRFLIPNKLISFAGLSGQVLVIGVGDLIEIWDPEKYSLYIAERAKHGAIEEISERLFGAKSGNGQGNDTRTEK